MSPVSDSDVHHEALEWLPMMVNGTLSAALQQRLDAHLKDCAECRDEAALMQRAFTHIKEDSVSVDVDAALERANARIDAESTVAITTSTSSTTEGFQWQSLFSTSWLTWMGGAAAAALVLIVSTNLQTSDSASTPSYEVLSSGDNTSPGVLLIDLELAEALPAEALSRHFAPLVDSTQLRIVQQDGQRYRLALSGDANVALVAELLDRSRRLPGYVNAGLVSAGLGGPTQVEGAKP